jgi:two-component system NtrC family sensor kinase
VRLLAFGLLFSVAPLTTALFVLLLTALAGLGLLVVRLRRRAAVAEGERTRVADELSRRLSELFSLQELSYVLSESLVLDRIAEQVTRYAMRFLDARGVLLALAGEERGTPLRVVAADGTLASLAGRAIALDDPGLVARSVTRDRLEITRDALGGPIAIASDVSASLAAAVPLRAHGVVVGTLVITEPRTGQFEAEHVRLLSTVATHAAVVLANARFFSLVEHAKEQWETAFDALREGIAVVDAEGRVRRANRALGQLLGRSVESVVGSHLCHALLDRSHALMELLDRARLGEGPPPLSARSEPRGRTVRIVAARIPSATAEQSVVVLVEDVTEQRAMETQLIQSEKLAAVGQLVSGVAHELNNPLTSIAGLAELLLEQKGPGSKDRGHLQVIHEQAERASRIVRNLLTFARKGPAEQTRLDLGEVVRRTLQLMTYDLRLKDIEVHEDLATDLPDILGDRHALQQVALNLLTNAAQAVAGNPPGRPRRIHVRTWFDGDVRLRVADTGPGIPDEIAPHVFTPFFTTKEPGQGTGLGLSIAYSLVEAHGGRLTLEPSPDGGAAFRVDLPPASTDAPRRPTPPATPAPAVSPARRTILLVDDDPAVGRLVKAFFGRDGHTVDVARSPDHAIELLGARFYDLVIADGRATTQQQLLVEQLLQRHPQIKDRLLVATGDVRPSTEAALQRLGLRYLRKPFNLRLLRDEAARVWAPGALS